MHSVWGFYYYLINTQHKNFYYFYLYACKTVVLSSLTLLSKQPFASIELTFGFNQINSQSKQPSIELTQYLLNWMFNIFCRRTVGFPRQAKVFEVNCFIIKSIFSRFSSQAGNNFPHRQSIFLKPLVQTVALTLIDKL